MTSSTPSAPAPQGMPPALSLRVGLATALATVVADAATGETPLVTSPGLGRPPLRLSRNPKDIAYLYRPDYRTTETGGPSQPSPPPLDLASRWNARPSPGDIASLRALSFLQGPRLGAYLSAHTLAHPLAQGQLLLRPSTTALGAWLEALAFHCPPPPVPGQAVTVPFPLRQAPLAEILHLSPLALLQYTHMRCHRLTPALPPPADPEAPPSVDPRDIALDPRAPTQQNLWRALVALVDDLAMDDLAAHALAPDAVAPAHPPLPVLRQGFLKGYSLCVAVDGWLRELPGQSPSPTAGLMLQGITHSLAHLLQGWLQAPAPTGL